MNAKQVLFSVLLSILATAGILAIYHFYFQIYKIAYVRTGEVISAFNGFKDAQKQFEKDYSVVQGNADTLKRRFEAIRADQELQKKSAKTWAYQLGIAENEFMQYQKNAEAQLNTRQAELSRNAVDKINVYIQDYGKAKGYKLVLGSTDNGSILYGQEGDDITKLILEGLNKKYPSDSLK